MYIFEKVYTASSCFAILNCLFTLKVTETTGTCIIIPAEASKFTYTKTGETYLIKLTLFLSAKLPTAKNAKSTTYWLYQC